MKKKRGSITTPGRGGGTLKDFNKKSRRSRPDWEKTPLRRGGGGGKLQEGLSYIRGWKERQNLSPKDEKLQKRQARGGGGGGGGGGLRFQKTLEGNKNKKK